MKRIKLLIVCAIVGLLWGCNKDSDVSSGSGEIEVDYENVSTNYFLPENGNTISSEVFTKHISQGVWYLNNVINVLDDGAQIDRTMLDIDGQLVECPIFCEMIGWTPSWFETASDKTIIESWLSDADAFQLHQAKGIYSYDDNENLLTIETRTSSEIDGKHRLLSISDEELSLSGRPFSPANYPNAVYAIYIYKHEKFSLRDLLD